jgi:hypothetical protein
MGLWEARRMSERGFGEKGRRKVMTCRAHESLSARWRGIRGIRVHSIIIESARGSKTI